MQHEHLLCFAANGYLKTFWEHRRLHRLRMSRRSSPTSGELSAFGTSSPGTARTSPVPPATPRSTRPEWHWKASTSSAVTASVTAPSAKATKRRVVRSTPSSTSASNSARRSILPESCLMAGSLVGSWNYKRSSRPTLSCCERIWHGNWPRIPRAVKSCSRKSGANSARTKRSSSCIGEPFSR